ncbi:NapC/NirT family cytochrome c [Bacillus sp. Marseille-P3661]|uniref:NapC/NirT family cytochrome c n=1 Tax=Bacillus sp. Marseille-P3661 TaxID=1936234 RepID=UPI000C832D9C|nr:NapC/NirT family cytochrome c [Bacillus sp. Marseille-P3661]
MFEKFKTLDKKLLLLIGLFFGIVLAAASAEALHYTDTADFCSTCHPMDTAYSSFSDSVHADIACNECHAPTDNIVSKYMFKAKAGAHDVYMNTLNVDEIPDVIHAKQATEDVVQENCISCHQNTIQTVEHNSKDKCINCHRQVPHGKKNKLKTDEWNAPGEYEIKGREDGVANE